LHRCLNVNGLCHCGTGLQEGEPLQTYHFIWAMAAVTGLVPAGLAGSCWAIFTGHTPRVGMLHRFDFLTPLKVIALVVYAPLGVVRTGLSYLDQNPFIAIPILLLGLGWSFLQGVFILTTFFGYT
jgi:threonine/homoserine efflux transporter RhtA